MYFMDQLDDPTLADKTQLEFIHYNLILYDQQIFNTIAFRANKVAHVYSLLSHISFRVEGGENISL